MTPIQRYLPWAVVTLAGIYLAYCAMPPRQTGEFDLGKFGNLPIMYNGRIQPLDSLARNALMIVSGRQTFYEEVPDGVDAEGNKKVRRVYQQAARWLIDLWATDINWSVPITGPAAHHKVIRIENDQVRDLLELERREGLRYSMAEIQRNIHAFMHQVKVLGHKDPKTYDVFDEKIQELGKHLQLCQGLAVQDKIFAAPDKRGGEPFPLAGLVEEQHKFELHSKDEGVTSFWGYVFLHLEMTYRRGDPAEFNKLLDTANVMLQKTAPGEFAKCETESLFNRAAPFYNSLLLYIFAATLVLFSWLAWAVWDKSKTWPQTLLRSAFALCVLTLAVHTVALIARMYLSGRWGVFVTNLYSSAIFIGWGCVAVGLILELIYPYGIGCAVGSITGALSLIIAHYLSLGGDTLEMLVAVLDTNFWLATHVTCVTFGYTATFVAGFLGIGYVLAGIAVPNLSREVSQIFTRMIYGVICFATLLSFTGTVLGGIWADQSWGRFWGWDPKENGALLIVMMNALTLHARWGGMIKARGLAVLAILGNIVTAWSWFGVNMLGVGLHNYGFMEGAVFWIVTFVVSQLLLAVLGMFEPAKVRSFFASMLALNPPAPQQAKASV